MIGAAGRCVALAVVVRALAPSPAAAQACLTCRSEACPRKASIDAWCGTGRDPLLQRRGKPAVRPRAAPQGGATAAAATAPSCPPGSTLVTGRPSGSTPVVDLCFDETEVTVAEYAACVATGTCSAAAADTGCNQTTDRSAHPINCVDWFQAALYCRFRGGRLPTGAEWAWAAGAAGHGWRYPWGDGAPGDQLCWDGLGDDLARGERTTTCPVRGAVSGGSPQGIHDLAGNVAEWVEEGEGPARVARGGSFASFRASSVAAAGATRIPVAEGHRVPFIGFRCVRAPAARP